MHFHTRRLLASDFFVVISYLQGTGPECSVRVVDGSVLLSKVRFVFSLF
jgi:hypothetical protein